MRPLRIAQDANGQPLRVLCLGAHPDDIEIGCGATLLALAAQLPLVCRWVVFSGAGTPREAEARLGARRFLQHAQEACVTVHAVRDGFFPSEYAALKERFESLKQDAAPDVIFTHWREDRHHFVLEYEVPKYDGDLGRPNCYVPLARRDADAKVRYLLEVFETQRDKHWFTADTFGGLLRLRGVEAGIPAGVAEAFYMHKALLDV